MLLPCVVLRCRMNAVPSVERRPTVDGSARPPSTRTTGAQPTPSRFVAGRLFSVFFAAPVTWAHWIFCLVLAKCTSEDLTQFHGRESLSGRLRSFVCLLCYWLSVCASGEVRLLRAERVEPKLSEGGCGVEAAGHGGADSDPHDPTQAQVQVSTRTLDSSAKPSPCSWRVVLDYYGVRAHVVASCVAVAWTRARPGQSRPVDDPVRLPRLLVPPPTPPTFVAMARWMCL